MTLHFSRSGWMIVKCGWCISWLWCLLMVFSLLVRYPRARAWRRDLGQKWSGAVGLLFNNPLILGLISLQCFGHLGYKQFLGYTSEESKILGGRVECWAGHLVFGLGAHQCRAFALFLVVPYYDKATHVHGKILPYSTQFWLGFSGSSSILLETFFCDIL